MRVLGFVVAGIILSGFMNAIPRAAIAEEARPQSLVFELRNLNNELVSSSSLKGKVLYVDLWASWCHACKLSLGWLKRLEAKIGAPDFKVISINIDERREDVVRVIEEFDLGNMVILLDPQASVAESYNMRATPTSFVVDRSGMIIQRFDGWSSSEAKEVEAAISKALVEGQEALTKKL